MKMLRDLSVAVLAILVNVIAIPAYACDLCSIYNSVESQKPVDGSLRLGVVEQFTEYGKLQENGHKVDNEMHQRLNSSITQVVGAYDFSNAFGLQISLPYINRGFSRVEGGAVQKGTEAGIGDMTILGRYVPYQYRDGDALINVQLLGGVKLPTGDSDRLKEELSEAHHHGDEASMQGDDHDSTEMESIKGNPRHEGHDHEEESVASAVHGHDLALGSGSFDYPVGVSVLAEKGRVFAKGGVIYTIRTAGDHQYQYADDLMWDFGPGYYLHLDHESDVAVRAVLSGENKSKDSGKDKEIQGDTGITSMFIGPEINFVANSSLSGDIGLDLPIDINNSEFQAVASYRLRAGLTYRF